MLKEQARLERETTWDEMVAKAAMLDQVQQENERAKELLSQLHEAGTIDIDEHGNVSPSKQKPRN